MIPCTTIAEAIDPDDPADPRNRVVGYYTHLAPNTPNGPDTMTQRFDHCSVWRPESDDPTYHLGRGRIELDDDDDYASVRVTTAKWARADLPDDIEGYTVLCSEAGEVVYEGTVLGTERIVSEYGQREELRCDPAALED